LKTVAVSILFIIFIIGLCTQLEAQSGRMRAKPGSPESKDDVLRLRAEEVLLPVSVRSFNGRLPQSLKPDDFILSEDDRRQRITAVERAAANILLIIDTSGELTLVKSINRHRQLALKILQGLGDKDQAAIMIYSDKVELISSWTNDKDALRRALEGKFRPGLKARLYDSILLAAQDELPKVRGRRSIALITDGVDSFNPSIFSTAIAALHRARATVYVVNVGGMILEEIKPRAYNPLSWYEMIDPRQRELIEKLRAYAAHLKAGETQLNRVVEETGGMMWKPESEEEFLKINSRVIEEIGSEYVIAYLSERKADDKDFHYLKVYAARRDLIVRSRRGIYANIP
jgi:VWFA-related protein